MAFRAFMRWLRLSHRRSNSPPETAEHQPSELPKGETDKQERVIVTHTVIQTWTNILSVAFSAVTAIALIVLAYFQWQASERGVAAGLRAVELEYAKSRLTYSVSQTVASNAVFRDLVSRNRDTSLIPMADTASVRVKGEASSVRIRPEQSFKVTKIIETADGITHEDMGCYFRAQYFYEYYNDTEFYAPDFFRVPDYNPFFENRGSEALIIEPTTLSIDIVYIDVFDQRRVDSLLVANGGEVLVERNSRPRRIGTVADISIENGKLRVVQLGTEPDRNGRCDEILFNSDERPIRRRQ